MLSTPILNYPQSAILGMHNIVDRPVAVNGKVEIRPIMYVALSYDHRIIDGKDSGRKTDEDGNYKIKIKPSVLNLGVFTTITGIVEEPVNGRNTINFTLEKFVPSNSGAEVPLSEEDVVDSGYGVSRKKDLTKSVTKTDVSGKQYTTFNSIYDMLQTISGVYVSGSNVTIRGTATTGNTSPLFVVNGSVVSSISGIDPAMVSSIEVLKGPAASIYGMQGANGVIIIKLK